MKGKRFLSGGLMVMVVGMLSVAAWTGRAAAAEVDPFKLMYECQAACDKVKDFTATFTKQEMIDGDLAKMETVKMKFREKPFSVYLHWFKNPHEGREVIYQEGRYDSYVEGHQPVGPLNFSKRTKPESSEALKHSRRPITQAGFRNAIRLFVEKTELGKQRNEMYMAYMGTEAFDERPVHVLCRTLTVNRDDYPCHIGLLYIDKQLMIPVKVVAYEWDYRLQALYTYSDVKLNVGLTDKDFDMENPQYNFPAQLFKGFKLWPFESKDDKKK